VHNRFVVERLRGVTGRALARRGITPLDIDKLTLRKIEPNGFASPLAGGFITS